MPLSTAEYGCSNWTWWLNNTTITLGMQNVFDSDPPFVAGSFENGYDESLATHQRPVLVRPAKEEILGYPSGARFGAPGGRALPLLLNHPGFVLSV